MNLFFKFLIRKLEKNSISLQIVILNFRITLAPSILMIDISSIYSVFLVKLVCI